jgi:sortase A
VASGTVTESPAAPPPSPTGRRLRRLSTALIALGVGVLLYAGVILAWGDPITWVWTHWQQRQLQSEFARDQRQYQHAQVPDGQAAELAWLRQQAISYEAQAREGHAWARLSVPSIGLSNVVVVQGTQAATLTDPYGDLGKGPGHYMDTPAPGLGRTVAIAGHRTTFGAWFRHIDSIDDGDWIALQMPYGTFHYRVEYHKIVSPNGTRAEVIKPVGYERLMLSACNPLYSATQRWLVYARAMRVTLPDGSDVQLQ